MKFSIITVSYNDGALLERSIESVMSQRLDADDSIEHIIVLGGEAEVEKTKCEHADASCRYTRKILKSEPRGCYNAINIGIANASGDIIGLVDGSNYLTGPCFLASISEMFSNKALDYAYGDVVYMHEGRKVRRYSSEAFSSDKLMLGFAPPHPSLFITSKALGEVGFYREKYAGAADFDFFVRLMHKHSHLCGERYDGCGVAMSAGGQSMDVKAVLWQNTLSKYRILKENGFDPFLPKLMLRYLYNCRK